MQICKYCLKARDSTRFLALRLLLSSSRLDYFYGLLRLPCGGSEHSLSSAQPYSPRFSSLIARSVSVEKRNRNLYEKCKFRCLVGTIDNAVAFAFAIAVTVAAAAASKGNRHSGQPVEKRTIAY